MAILRSRQSKVCLMCERVVVFENLKRLDAIATRKPRHATHSPCSQINNHKTINSCDSVIKHHTNGTILQFLTLTTLCHVAFQQIRHMHNNQQTNKLKKQKGCADIMLTDKTVKLILLFTQMAWCQIIETPSKLKFSVGLLPLYQSTIL